MKTLLTMATIIALLFNPLFKRVRSFEDIPLEERAALAGMAVDDFVFISSVTEAESDRSTAGTEGRVMIALTILNRVNDDRFPDTINGVLTQAGQFSTVRNGASVTGRTDLSDMAVIEAVQWLEQGDAPAVLFFNCVGYNYGEPYGDGAIGGNYFMTWEE